MNGFSSTIFMKEQKFFHLIRAKTNEPDTKKLTGIPYPIISTETLKVLMQSLHFKSIKQGFQQWLRFKENFEIKSKSQILCVWNYHTLMLMSSRLWNVAKNRLIFLTGLTENVIWNNKIVSFINVSIPLIDFISASYSFI